MLGHEIEILNGKKEAERTKSYKKRISIMTLHA